MKDRAYWLIHAQTKYFKVKGSYVGLSAAYTPEIYAVLADQIQDRFVNCQINKKDYCLLRRYQHSIFQAYPKEELEVSFELKKTDILNYLLTQRGEFSIYDLDFMGVLTKELIERIFVGVIYSVKLPATVAIWHTAGRAVTNKQLEDQLRPMLNERFSSIFKVRAHTRINYYEGFPMRCDVLTLENK